ncbi:MAG: pyruvate kinase [Bdellovibrionales bacterium]|nr:pyruvate kinase [Bdellovibrionales bacterium]
MIGISKRKTKIVATIGPASRSAEKVAAIIAAGANVFRLNFSHGTHEEHSETLKTIREQAALAGVTVAILQDLCGPKVRITVIEGGETTLHDGSQIILRHGNKKEFSSSSELIVDAFDPAKVMRKGQKALLADGRVELHATKVETDRVICDIVSGGPLRGRSGIALPDSRLDLPCLTEKDLEDAIWGVKHEVDYIALSFVSSAADVNSLREHIAAQGAKIPIIAKIERSQALDNLTEIVGVANAVMVARGDLGLELPLERVPIAQKFIIDQANFVGTPVITATQMLQSMVSEVRPTRAEVSDVCTAVLDGTDAVMLSEETAIGKHPIEAVKYLHKILLNSEQEFQFEERSSKIKGSDRDSVADATCFAACGAASKIDSTAIVACTNSGYTARLVAKYRPRQVLFGATSEPKTLGRMALYWGVQPVLFSIKEDTMAESEIVSALTTIREKYGVKPGSRIVVTAGLRAKKSGTTNLMEIREVPRNT